MTHQTRVKAPMRPMARTRAQFNPEKPPALEVAQWFNAPEPLTLKKLKGKVVVLVAFQMLCPGSLRHALPQAQRLARAFNGDEVAVLGLHMVFENHKDMTPSLLEPFLKAEHITIPVAVDAPNGSGLPGPWKPTACRARRRCCCSTARGACAATTWAPSTTCASAPRSWRCARGRQRRATGFARRRAAAARGAGRAPAAPARPRGRLLRRPRHHHHHDARPRPRACHDHHATTTRAAAAAASTPTTTATRATTRARPRRRLRLQALMLPVSTRGSDTSGQRLRVSGPSGA